MTLVIVDAGEHVAEPVCMSAALSPPRSEPAMPSHQ